MKTDGEDGAELEEGRDLSDEASRNRREPRAGRLWQAGRQRSEQVDEYGIQARFPAQVTGAGRTS